MKVEEKKIIRILLIVIIMFIIENICAFYLYTHKDILKQIKLYRSVNNYKNNINSKYNSKVENNEVYHNAAYKLKLESAYGDNEAYHPKVLNFEKPWNGYKYWMVFSPYPHGDDGKENPHIKVSNDLINWENPKGFKNPLVEAPDNYKHEVIYNSDPHIVYNSDTDTLECYYRFVNDKEDKVVIYRLTTKDGVNWTDKEEILTATRSKKDYISPAIIYENSVYKMWFVDRDRSLKYIESKDGHSYENEKTIKLNYPIADLTTWHIDVIKADNGYELIVVAYKSWKDRNSMNLYYFNSKDNINYGNGKTILRPSLIGWDNRGIYRSSLMYENDTYYVFYSGVSNTFERGVGMSYGKHIENLIGSNINYEKSR